MATLTNKKESQYVSALLKVNYPSGKFKLKKSDIEDIISFEEISPETRPYVTHKIIFDDLCVILKKDIVIPVRIEEDNYFLTLKDLDLEVWGETREKAIEAFRFAFYSLYVNFVIEDDAKLSETANLLKRKIKGMIKEVTSVEAKKKN